MDRIGAPRVASRDIQRAAHFTFEVIQNTRDHGAQNLFRESIEGVRLVTVRLVPLRKVATRQALIDPVQAYSARLLSSDVLLPDRPRSVLEITVGDCGIGIAARLMRTMEVYRDHIDQERSTLMRALVLRATSKAQTQSGAGYGLFSAMLATHDLRGMVLVRTGRLLVYRDFLEQSLPDDLAAWVAHEAPFVAGTSVSLLFPLFESTQVHLDL